MAHNGTVQLQKQDFPVCIFQPTLKKIYSTWTIYTCVFSLLAITHLAFVNDKWQPKIIERTDKALKQRPYRNMCLGPMDESMLVADILAKPEVGFVLLLCLFKIAGTFVFFV